MFVYNKIKKLKEIKFVKDSSYTILSHFFLGISGLLVNTIVANYYNVESLGVLSQALAIYMILSLFSNFGIQTSAQKHTSQHANNRKLLEKIFSSAVFATTISSFVVLIFFTILLVFFPKIISSKALLEFIKIMIFGVTLFAINKTINNFLTGLREMKTYSLVRVMRWVIICLLILLIGLNNLPFKTIAYSFVVAEMIIMVFFFVKTKKLFGTIDFNWTYIHLSFGLKSILSEVAATLNTRIPILIIGYIIGNEAAGYYSYIESFAFSILMISAAVQKNFNPVFTRLWHKNNILIKFC